MSTSLVNVIRRIWFEAVSLFLLGEEFVKAAAQKVRDNDDDDKIIKALMTAPDKARLDDDDGK